MSLLVLPGSTEAFARREAGGKGWNLHRLHALGLPVPPFCVLGRRHFQRFVDGNGARAAIAGWLAELAAGRATPEEVEGRAARLFETTPLGPELEAAVARAFAVVAPGTATSIAVRSSAADEDSAAHSFAGQLSSVLEVADPAAAARALRRCWASAFSARSLHYRRERGLPADGAAIAVAVVFQRMVDARASGVLFTCDPAAGTRDHFVISAVPGLGEALVSGAVDADTFHLDAATGEVARQALVGTASSLAPAELQALWQLGRRLLAELGAPQDVEWAIDRAGALQVLQTRPVTTPLTGEGTGYPHLWDNSNIVESYGGLTAPLSFTFALRNYRNVYVQFCEILGLPASVVRDMEPYLGNMLGCIHGRVYYNLYNWYKLVGVLPGFRHNREFMETMMGVRQALSGELAARLRPHESWDTLRGRLRRLWVGVRFFGYHLRIQALCDRFLRFFDGAHRRFRALDYRRMRSDDIFAAYQRMEREMLGQWKAPIINDFLCMVHFGLLRKLTRRWLGERDPDIQNDLLAGDGHLESAEPTRVLLEMARAAAAQPALRRLLVETPPEDLLEALQQSPEHHQFHGQVRSYIDRFGFRCMSEMKLEETDLFADPRFLFVVLQNYLRAPEIPDPEAQARRERARRADAEARLRRALPWGPRRWIYLWSLRHARRAVRNRENTRFARTRAYGVARAMFHAMGEDLAARGILRSPGDVFFLGLDEVAGVHQGTLPAFDLAALAAERRRAYDGFAGGDEPLPRFQTRGPVYWQNPIFAGEAAPPATEEGADLRGLPCCAGVVEGVVKVVRSPGDDLRLAGEILVAPRTDPGWVPLYPSVSGLLVEKGSLLSHSAIVAREMGLPAIVAIPGLTRVLKSGMRVRMDGQRGTVVILP